MYISSLLSSKAYLMGDMPSKFRGLWIYYNIINSTFAVLASELLVIDFSQIEAFRVMRKYTVHHHNCDRLWTRPRIKNHEKINSC
jgi:hypothetical protein